MKFKRFHLLFAFAAAMLGAVSVSGQIITGNLVGTVQDESGAVLPGATVTITSPALPAGPATVTSNEKGQYRFPGLSPGVYSLKVDLSGFASYTEEGLRVTVGGTLERIITLKVAALAETITVTGESPIVDVQKSGVSTNYTTEFMQNTPLRRFSMFDFMKNAPGISATAPSRGDTSAVSAFGSGTNENQFLMDGTDFTSPVGGAAWPWPDTDVIEEIEIVSFGASAEYGNLQGAVFNVVTKQGGNDWRFDTSYYNMSQSLTSQPIKLDCSGCPEPQSGFHRDKFHDFTIHGGGPIVKDRLWIFGGYQYQRDYDTQPGTDPRFPRKFEADRVYWKVNWQITPKLKLMHNYHDDYWVIPATPTSSRPFETIETYGGRNPSVTFVNLTHLLSEDTFWDARFSGFVSPNDYTRPNSGSRTLPRTIETTTNVASGGSGQFGSFHQVRLAAHGKVSHYATDFLGGDHDFKFGVQFVHGSTRSFYGYAGGAHYYTYNGAPYYAYFREPYTYGGQFPNVGVFAEDAFRIGDRLTLNLGVRYDYNKAVSQDLPALDREGNETGGTVSGLGDLYTWNVLAPRLGFNLKLTEDGRTVLRGNYARFYQGLFTAEYSFVHPGITPLTLAFYDPSTGRYSDIVSVTDPKANLRVDPNTKTPFTDQFSIGFDRELATDLAISATYIRKDGDNFTGWVDIGGRYGTGTASLADGRTIPVFPLLNRTADRLYLLTNPEGWFFRYNGLLLTFNKRWSKNWQALVSYTLSEAEGLQASNGRPPHFSQISRGGSSTFGRDPNDLTNATGNLINDRTHMFLLQGAVEMPKTGILVGANFRYLSGKPYAAQARVRLPQGNRLIYIEPLGSRRLSPQKLFDLRVSKIFRFAGHRKLEILVDILNVLNNTAEERIITRDFFSPNFSKGDRFIDPRRGMIGVKLSF
jgi:outer membrane receptor protein involved in Fe transport